ncbi:MAG: hypothetical protein R3F61_01640 [Myxococcota bacterium]
MILTLLVACNPWRGIANEEAVWWGATDRIEREQNLDLVELPAGAPIGYWPRIVIYDDRIEVDDRAWFLSLPQEVFEHDELVERLDPGPFTVAPVVDGRVPDTERRGHLIHPLYDRLLAVAESHKDLAMNTDDPALEFDGRVTLVPDAGTSIDLLSAVIYTAGQAQFGSAALVGASGGRLRMATEFDGTSCALVPVLEASRGGAHLTYGGLPLRGATCPSDANATIALIDEVAAACTSRFDAITAAAAERAPGAPAIDPSEWRCTVVHMLTGDGAARSVDASVQATTAADLLVPMAALHPRHPDIRQGYVLGGMGGGPEPCDQRLSLDALSPAQLDQVCNVVEAAEALAFAQDQVARGWASMRWGRRPRVRLDRTPDALDALDGLDGLSDLLAGATTIEAAIEARKGRWASVESTAVDAAGTPSPSALDTLRRYSGQLLYCLDQVSSRDVAKTPLRDRPVTFVAGVELRDGRVGSHDLRVEDDAEVQRCAATKLRRWRFDPDLTGTFTLALTARWDD